MAVVSNGTTIADAGSFSVGLGDMVHIKTLTASSSANLSFVHGTSSVVLDSTYPVYLFSWINCHPATNNVTFKAGFRDGGTNYDATVTSNSFNATADEAGTDAGLNYQNGRDLAQGTGFQNLFTGVGTDNDQSGSGYLHLFNPSSTTFVKHFIARFQHYMYVDFSQEYYTGGYGNTTSAVDAVRFQMSSGNIDSGTIDLYGVK